MKRILCLLIFALLAVGSRAQGEQSAAAGPTETEAQAIAALRKLGAFIETDPDAPAGPVIGVYLAGSGVTDAELDHLKPLAALKTVSLYATPVTDFGLARLAGLSQLQALNLEACHAVTDAGLVHLQGLSQLNWLCLQETKITDAGLESLTALKELQSLYLRDTRITDAGFEKLRQMKRLDMLYLGGSGVTKAGTEAFERARTGCHVYQ